MQCLSEIFDTHKSLLDEEQSAMVVEYLRRNAERHSFAYPAEMSQLEAQSGFVLFERIFSDTPVHLFAQDIPLLRIPK